MADAPTVPIPAVPFPAVTAANFPSPVTRVSPNATQPTVPSLRAHRAPARARRTTRPAQPGISPWWHWVPLLVWAEVLQIVLYSNSGYSWHFLDDGVTLLFGGHPAGMIEPGGLHLYANYPQLQIGPLTLLVVAVLLPVTTTGGWMIAVWFMTLAGLAVLLLIERLAAATRRTDAGRSWTTTLTMLVGGGSFLLSWELLAVHFSHLDDVLTLVMLAATAGAVAYRSPTLAGLFLGLAADAKPWALACAAMLLALPGRARWRALAVAAIAIGVAWLPFVLGDPHTLHAASSFAIPNVPASALRALGVDTPTTPSWDWLAQVGSGCLLGAIAVFRGRWQAVLALGIGTRIALDPSTYTYYTAGLALGLLWWDLIAYPRRRLPLLSLVCLVAITGAPMISHDAHLLGEFRLWSVLLVIGVLVVAPRKLPVIRHRGE